MQPDRRSLRRLWSDGWRWLEALRSPLGYNATGETSSGLYPAMFGRDSLWVVLFLLELIGHRTDALRVRVGDVAQRVLLQLLHVDRPLRRDDRIEAQPGRILHTHWATPPTRPRIHLRRCRTGRRTAGSTRPSLFVIAATGSSKPFPARGTGAFSSTRPTVPPTGSCGPRSIPAPDYALTPGGTRLTPCTRCGRTASTASPTLDLMSAAAVGVGRGTGLRPPRAH